MTGVPTTPTAADALADRKKILDENSLLRQERDTLRRETEGWQAARDAVRGELQAMTGLVFSTSEYDDRISAALRKDRDGLTGEIADLEAEKTSKEADAAKAGTELKAKRDMIGELEKQESELKDKIGAQEESGKASRIATGAEIERLSGELKGVSDKLEKAKADLKATEADNQKKTEWILSEEKRLANKSRDLLIYEGRVRKAAEALGMEIII